MIKTLKGRFQDICRDWKNNSVDHIITDPPYPKEYLQEWSDLSEVAARILKPSGFCICYSGGYHLLEVMDRLSEYLEYYWVIALVHKGAPGGVYPVKINAKYKPIVIFQKPPRKSQDNYISDVIIGSGRSKGLHPWQQGEEELEPLIEAFTKENDLILDPFAGSGTTGAACYKLHRNCILIDVNDISFNQRAIQNLLFTGEINGK